MPKSCSAGGCSNHHLQIEKNLSFFKFPDVEKDSDRRQRWIWACGRQNADGSDWKPTAKYLYLCSEHFITGKPNTDVTHSDFVPSIFKRTPKTLKKGDSKLSRYSSAKKRKLYFDPAASTDQSTHPSDPIMENSLEETSPTIHPTTDDAVLNAGCDTSERDRLFAEINNLREERDKLKEQLNKSNSAKLSSAIIDEDHSKAKFYTGISWIVFQQTFIFLQQFISAKPGKMSYRDQFFVTLVKVRQNICFEYLAHQTGVGVTTISDIFWRWIDLIEVKLSFMLQWPDRETMRSTIPPVFKTKFPRLTNIIDCFEIFIENPKKLKARAQCYSNYKKHTTVKFLISCNPLGSVIFLSKAWGGRVSDIELTRKSGYISLDFHNPGDQILADRGFMVQEDMATVCSAELILPAFTRGKKQLSAQEVETSRKLASVRIHIERVIGLMKNRFSILQGTLPLHFVNSCKIEAEGADELSVIDKLVRVCAILTNLGDGIVYKNNDDN